MKKFLSKISFCSIIILSCICFYYINTTDLSENQNGLNITEIEQPVNDKMIGSVKTASILFSRVLEVLSHRGDV
jgi:hypothetical protein